MELNLREIQAVHSYVSSGGYTVNEKLRYGITDFTPHEQHMIDHLDKALDKLSLYQGDISRSLHLRPSQVQRFLEIHRAGSLVSYQGYTSFTRGETYNPEAVVQIYIENSRLARDLSSYNPSEQEVLYPRNTVFRVAGVIKDDGFYEFFFEEVD